MRGRETEKSERLLTSWVNNEWTVACVQDIGGASVYASVCLCKWLLWDRWRSQCLSELLTPKAQQPREGNSGTNMWFQRSPQGRMQPSDPTQAAPHPHHTAYSWTFGLMCKSPTSQSRNRGSGRALFQAWGQ